jgi:hypothetical protein
LYLSTTLLVYLRPSFARTVRLLRTYKKSLKHILSEENYLLTIKQDVRKGIDRVILHCDTLFLPMSSSTRTKWSYDWCWWTEIECWRIGLRQSVGKAFLGPHWYTVLRNFIPAFAELLIVPYIDGNGYDILVLFIVKIMESMLFVLCLCWDRNYG